MKKNVLFLGIGIIVGLLLILFVKVPVDNNGLDMYVIDTSKIIDQQNVTTTIINNSKLINVKSSSIKDIDLWLRNNANNIDYNANKPFLKNLHFVHDINVVGLIESSNMVSYQHRDIFKKINNQIYGEYLSLNSNNDIIKDTTLRDSIAQLSAPAVYAIFDGLIDNDKIEFAKYKNNSIDQIGIKITKQNNTTSEYYNFSTDPGKPSTVFAVPLYEYLLNNY